MRVMLWKYTYSHDSNSFLIAKCFFFGLHFSCASLQQEEDFQATREAFLRTWIEAVFAKQSSESTEYRLELRKFLSA